MKKTTKLILVLSMVVIFTFSAIALVACKTTGEPKLNVTVASVTDIKVGDSLDSVKQYLTVKYTDSDNNTTTVTNYELQGTLTEGSTTLTVKYQGLTAFCNIMVGANVQQDDTNQGGSSNPNKGENVPKKPTVTVNANGGTFTGHFIVNEDNTLTEPIILPTRPNYEFDGWYKDEELTTPWNFTTDKVTEDITLYVKWSKIVTKYTVTFNTNGGGADISLTDIEEESLISKPIVPKRDGYVLLGWYKDIELLNQWNFNTDRVTKDITVYAKWLAFTDGLEFSLNDDDTYSVSGIGTVTEAEIAIPEEYNGKKVTKIAEQVFIQCTTITSVVFPDTITTIGLASFAGCENLTNIVFSNSIEAIDGYAFQACTSLIDVYIPANVTSIGEGAFSYCTNLSTVQLLGVKNLADGVFFECGNLEKLSVSNAIEFIGNSVFYNCNQLQTNRYDNALYLGDDENPYVILLQCADSNIDSCDISLDTVIIDDGAFYECANLTEITIPHGVKSIPYACFAHCTSLTNVMLHDDIRSIGDNAFEECNQLSNLILPKNLAYIGPCAFIYCNNLSTVYFNMTEEDLLRIAYAEDYVGTHPTSYAKDIFIKDADDNWQSIQDITQIEIPEDIVKITSDTLYDFTALKYVIIGDNVESISSDAFNRCPNLNSITISAQNANYCAVNGLLYNKAKTQLLFVPQQIEGSIVIDENVTTINSGVFKGRSKISSIVIGDKLKNFSINFDGCTSLESIMVSETNEKYSSQDGILYNKDKSQMVFVPQAIKGEITIPGTIKSLSVGKFKNREGLTKVVILDGIMSISSEAFYGCVGLTTVTLPDDLTSIGDSAFYGCINLSSIRFPSNLTNIGKNAFARTGFVTVYISRGIQEIGNTAFANCEKLETIYWYAVACTKAGSASAPVFYNCNKLNAIHIIVIYGDDKLLGVIPDYTFAGCGSVRTMTMANIKSIGNYAFYNCTNLYFYEIGGAVSSIGSYAFANCTNLQGPTIPDSVTSIGSHAFENCTTMTFVMLGKYVKTIGESAFANCSALETVGHYEGNKLTKIGAKAFENCANLKFFSLQDNFESLGEGVFSGCSGLQYFIVSENNKYYSSYDGILYNKNQTQILCVPRAIKGDVTIAEGVTSLGNGIFEKLAGLTGIVIPNSVELISGGAFTGCSHLKSITLPFIGREACSTYPLGYIFGTSEFDNAVKTRQYYRSPFSSTYITDDYYYVPSTLKTVIITGNNVPYGAFYNCSGLTTVELLDTVENIDDFTFYNCSGLINVNIPGNVTSIGESAFENCSSVLSITLPDGLETIGKSAFKDCSSLTEITISRTVILVKADSFANCSNLETISWNAVACQKEGYGRVFDGCSTLQTLIISEEVTCLPDSLFASACGIDSVYYLGDLYGWCNITFGTNPMSYANHLFINGEKLVGDIVIPDGAKNIPNGTFKDSSIVSLVIPRSVRTLESSVLQPCNTLETLTLSVASVSGSKFCYLFGSASTTKDPSVPTSLKEVTVTSGTIGSSFFANCGDIETIRLLDGVTTIKTLAFENCSKLASLEIFGNTISVGSRAFEGCDALEYNIYDNAKYLGNSDNLYAVLVSATEEEIPSCSIHENTKLIADSAFRNCWKLQSIVIPDGVRAIGDMAFYYCYSLKDINIPSSVRSIGGSVFDYCIAVESVTIDENNPIYCCKGNCIIEKLSATLIIGFNSSVIPTDGSVAIIGDYAFYECHQLTSVIIPDSVVTIEKSAFSNSGLKDISFGNSVKSIGEFAFSSCALTNITIPGSINTIGMNAFAYCRNLESVVVEEGVLTISAYAFIDCIKLTNIFIPDSITEVGGYAFARCSSLIFNTYENANYLGNEDNPYTYLISALDTSITSCSIHEDTKYIGFEAFLNCVDLETVTFGNKIKVIDSFAFKNCSSLTNLVLPSGLERIGSYAFNGCTALVSLVMPDSVIVIGASSFADCSNLTNVVITDGLKTIDSSAFSGCTNLTSIVMPNSLMILGNNAFNNCKHLQYTEYEGALYLGNDANPYVVFVKLQNTSLDTVVIHKNTKVIGHDAFWACFNLKSVVLPDGLVSIGNHAFSNCEQLTDIVIPDGVTTIGDGAFYRCSKLTDIIIPNSVTSIGAGAFRNCEGLTSITISDKVTALGTGAFQGCVKLETVYWNVASCIHTGIYSGGSVFSSCSKLTTIVMGESVTIIPNYVFTSCRGLTEIIFNGTMEEWDGIIKESDWNYDVPEIKVICSDGAISLS